MRSPDQAAQTLGKGGPFAPEPGLITPPARKTTDGKIAGLENLRGFAAFYVFLCHFLSVGYAHAGLFAFGKEAVFIFFFLSGFVIYTAYQTHPQQSFGTYFFRRFLRIYPLLLLCLFLSWLCIGHLQPPPDDRSWASFLGNVFMLQDEHLDKPGVWFGPFCGNSPLWSLSYEWWFYMLFFPMIRYLSPWQQRHTVAVLAVAAFLFFCVVPNQVSLFLMYYPIWWSGLELARVRHAETVEKRRTHAYLLVSIGVMAGISAVRVLMAYRHHVHLAVGHDPLLELRNFGFCWLCLATVTGLPLLYVRMALRTLYPFGWLAPISYATYILHMPLVVKAKYLSFIGVRWIESIGYILILLAVATWGETSYQRAAKRLCKGVAGFFSDNKTASGNPSAAPGTDRLPKAPIAS